MNLNLNRDAIRPYKSFSQKIRVLTEDWVNEEIYCPNCQNRCLSKYANNEPVADFSCANCCEDFELKSKQGVFGKKIVDGAYETMMRRLQSAKNPNLFLLNYDLKTFRVSNFLIIPKHFFIPKMIEKRPPLSATARRAGWIGCNIVIRNMPSSGKIFVIKDGIIESKEKVFSSWQKTLFLREEKINLKGWTLDIMKCVEKLNKSIFTLNEMYCFEQKLRLSHPENKHIKDKIRQQLQILRAKGYLEFTGNGNYRLV